MHSTTEFRKGLTSGNTHTVYEYRKLSLLALISRITSEGDREALGEFHNRRTPFRFGKHGALRLAEYLDMLRQNALERFGQNETFDELADGAYCLTIDKFGYLPPGEMGSHRVKQKGPDCRYYFQAFLQHLEKVGASVRRDSVEEEVLAARTLQSHVNRHFHLSWMECRRTVNPLVSRYYWKLNGATLCLWFPIHLKRGARRAWLETHADAPDPSRPGERQRIQELIDRSLQRQYFVDYNEGLQHSVEPARFSEAFLEKVSVEGLAAAVAWEKSESIAAQRPAIRRLGKEKLRQLVVEIFEELSRGTYSESLLARKFGLSKATFSRFAGSQWTERENNGSSIPDLWANTANTLAAHSDYVEAAKEAGVWSSVEKLITEK